MTISIRAATVGRFGRRPEPLLELLAEAGAAALESAPAGPIDRLVVGAMAAGPLAGEENLAARLADRLGLPVPGGLRVDAASASGAAAFHSAVTAISGGRADRVLVVAGERMTGRTTPEVTTVLARSLAAEELRAGATMPGLAALVAQVYLERHGLAATVLDRVSVRARHAGARNSNAHLTTAVDAEAVRESRPIAPPLHLFHCAPISDGAAAVVLERSDEGVPVLGLGEAFDAVALGDRESLDGFRATREAARRAYEMARITRKGVGVAELHDAFAPFALLDVEDVGLAGPGQGPTWFPADPTAPTPIPVNPSGGLLARGHPVGASGLAQIALVSAQLAGTAGPVQVDVGGPAGLAQSIGGLGSHVFITLLGHPEHR